MKIFLSVVLLMLCSSTKANEAKFNQFAEGALVVYSQFKRPSKEESERFYTFVQNKYASQKCSSECSRNGYDAATQYVKEKNIKIKDVQSAKK